MAHMTFTSMIAKEELSNRIQQSKVSKYLDGSMKNIYQKHQ